MTSTHHGADGWLECACGSRHWGLAGAAGMLLWRRATTDLGGSSQGELEVLLQHRALWSHHGGTWGLPGGAIDWHETPAQGALRECREEVGVLAEQVRVTGSYALRHPDWSYTTVLAQASPEASATALNEESIDARWVPVHEVADRELLPAFGQAWPLARTLLRRVVLVVDGANVVGSRPDGWWKDRRGAAQRLADALAATDSLPAAALDLPGETWFPQMVLVTEGQARGAGEALTAAHLQVVPAPGEGDEEILAQAAQAAADPDAHVIVCTADRGLRHRVSQVGAAHLGPGTLWRLLASTH